MAASAKADAKSTRSRSKSTGGRKSVGATETKSSAKAAKVASEAPKRGRSKSAGRRKSVGASEAKTSASKAKNEVKPTRRSVSRGRSKSRTRKSDESNAKAEEKPRKPSLPRGRPVKKSPPQEPKSRTPSPPPAEPRVSRRSAALRANAALTTSKQPSLIVNRGDAPPPVEKKPVPSLLSVTKDCIKEFAYRRTLSSLFWAIGLPVFVLAIHLVCQRNGCQLRSWPVLPKALKSYADPMVIGYGVVLIALQTILSAIPVGRVIDGFGYRRLSIKYRMNSFFCLTIGVAIFLALHFFLKHPNTLILHTVRFKCASAVVVLTIIVSLALYAKSFKSDDSHTNYGSSCSPAGNTGNFVHDFVFGREVSPKIGSGKIVDLGLVVVRSANLLWVLIILSSLLNLIQKKGEKTGRVFGLDISVSMVSAMQLLYVLLGSLNEVYLLKSAFIRQGVGFLNVFCTLALTPLLATVPLKYLADSNVPDLPIYCYPGMVVIFALGLFLIHYSNYLKFQNGLQGGRVLRQGPWMFVRHPNYLGELLCILAWTLPVGHKVIVPYAHLIFAALLMICRCMQLERGTSSDYKQYVTQVKYRVIPFIY